MSALNAANRASNRRLRSASYSSLLIDDNHVRPAPERSKLGAWAAGADGDLAAGDALRLGCPCPESRRRGGVLQQAQLLQRLPRLCVLRRDGCGRYADRQYEPKRQPGQRTTRRGALPSRTALPSPPSSHRVAGTTTGPPADGCGGERGKGPRGAFPRWFSALRPRRAAVARDQGSEGCRDRD